MLQKVKNISSACKHSEKSHEDRPIPRRAAFFQDDKVVQLIAAQGLRSPAVRSEYKTWLTGVVDRLNGIHHYRHKSKFTQVTNG